MRIRSHRIWIILFLGVFTAGGYLYYSMQENRQQLNEQGIRSLELTKKNLLNSWENYKVRSDAPPEWILENKFRLKEALSSLLEQKPPGGFFDLIILTDSGGNVLVSDPEVPVQHVSADVDTVTGRVGIVQSQMTISMLDYETFRIPLILTVESDPDGNQANYGEAQAGTESAYQPTGQRAGQNSEHEFTGTTGDSAVENVRSATPEEQFGGREVQLYLFGAIEKVKFNEAGRQISFTTLYILFTLIVLLIASFPVLRVLGMGRGDMLTGSHVYQVGLSLIAISIFAGFSISYLASRSEIVIDQHETVQNLAKQVSEIHPEKIERYAGVLETFFQQDRQPDEASRFSEQPLDFNEVLEINVAGDIVRMAIHGEDESLTEPDAAINIAERYYVRDAEEDRYLLGSHFSYRTGRQEGVLSRKHASALDNAGDPGFEPVIRAITFSFERLDRADADSLNPLGLKYLLVNQSGDVYFQSPAIKTNIPHLESGFGRGQWNEISHVMISNPVLGDTLEVNVSLDGHSYVASLHKLNFNSIELQQPLWMLTFRDKNLRYFRSYSIFIYSVAGYVFLVIVFLLLSMFMFLSGKTSHYLNIRYFAYSWYKPSRRKRKNYMGLLAVYLFHILYFLIIMARDLHNFWYVIFLFCETIAVLGLFRYILLSGILEKLNEKTVRLSDWIFPLMAMITALLFLVLASLVSTLGENQLPWIMVLFLMQIAGLVLIFNYNRTRGFRTVHSSTRRTAEDDGGITADRRILSDETLYAGTFTLWILLVGLFPGYAIHHSAFHYEDELWNMAVGQRLNAGALNSTGLAVDPVNSDSDRNFHKEFLNQLEYQRRQWLQNYSGIDYPVIDSYIYSGRQAIRSAFYPRHAVGEHDEHEKSYSTRFLKLLLALLFASLIYPLVSLLSGRFFLTRYWNFNRQKGLVDDVGDQAYLIALDNQKALEFLESRYLKDKNVKVLDLASSAVRENLRSRSPADDPSLDGVLALDIESALHTPEDVHSLTDLITVCRENEVFMLMTGSKSMKELREAIPEDRVENYETAMKNWIAVTGSFMTVIVPVDYSIRVDVDTEAGDGYDLVRKLRAESKIGPHPSRLTRMLEAEIHRRGRRNFELQDYEKFILNIQRINKAYYQNLWEKFSFREKQLVYNYANEGFVNYCNFDVLSELLQKGVFRMSREDEEVGLFSRSFGNYAAGAPSQELHKKFKKDKKEYGNLDHLRNALLTFVFLVILGISVVAPELLDRYVGAISGALALASTMASFTHKIPQKMPFRKEASEGI